ncbi:MAG: insulinase family protein [Opitutaceae bacterium]
MKSPLNLPRFVRSLGILCLGALFSASLTAAPTFTHESSDLPVDETVRYGSLSNGLRYALKTNQEPRDRTALRLLVEAGSLQEKESQLGLAHFLEHMAFNGSENYEPGTLIEFFQRMGMSFGGDTNAFTSFDRTVYMVDLPDSTDDNMEEGLQVFRDYAGGMLLLEEEIDRERGIVLSEKRTRDSVEWRSFLAELDFFYGDTRIAHRLPIGTEEILTNSTREDFVDFYDTWYRPEKMTIVAVGDFDIDDLEKKITNAFSDLTARGPARNEPPTDTVATVEGIHVLHHAESEAGNVTVGIQTVAPYTEEEDTAANRIKDLPRDLAFSMFNRRISEIAKSEGAPFIGGGGRAGSFYQVAENVSVELSSQTDRWQEALAVAENELRRALQFGFQSAELREVAAGMRNGLEQAVRRSPTRRSSSLAMGILSAVADETVFTTPQSSFDLFMPALDEVTIDACNQAFRDAWSSEHRFITVVGNTGDTVGPDADTLIAGIFARATDVALEPPAEIEEAAWAYTDFGPAGDIYKKEYIEDLDITLVEFSNRVRLNLKKTDYSAESISMSIRIGSGLLTEPTALEGLGVYVSNTFNQGGLGAHSADELRRILAGRNVGAGFGVGEDAFNLSGRTTPDDLLLQLQLAAAYIVDPGFRPEADRQMRKAITQYYDRLAHIPQGPLQTEVPRLLASGDTRFGLPNESVLDQRNLGEARDWLVPHLQSDAIEIAIVGDLDIDETIAAVAETFGALAPRKSRAEYANRRDVSFPAKPFDKEYRVPTEIPKAIVSLHWPTDDGMEVHTDRRLRVLGNILGDRLRLKIREELGDSYSPNAGSSTSGTYPGYGSIQASVTVDPEQTKRVAKVVRELADELARKGTNEDELKRAIQPILTGLRESERTNGYWLGAVLSQAQEQPQRLDWARSRYDDNEAITIEEINDLADQYLRDKQAFQIISRPE